MAAMPSASCAKAARSRAPLSVAHLVDGPAEVSKGPSHSSKRTPSTSSIVKPTTAGLREIRFALLRGLDCARPDYDLASCSKCLALVEHAHERAELICCFRSGGIN